MIYKSCGNCGAKGPVVAWKCQTEHCDNHVCVACSGSSMMCKLCLSWPVVEPDIVLPAASEPHCIDCGKAIHGTELQLFCTANECRNAMCRDCWSETSTGYCWHHELDGETFKKPDKETQNGGFDGDYEFPST